MFNVKIWVFCPRIISVGASFEFLFIFNEYSNDLNSKINSEDSINKEI